MHRRQFPFHAHDALGLRPAGACRCRRPTSSPHREHAEVAGAVLDAHVRATRQFARRAVVRARSASNTGCRRARCRRALPVDPVAVERVGFGGQPTRLAIAAIGRSHQRHQCRDVRFPGVAEGDRVHARAVCAPCWGGLRASTSRVRVVEREGAAGRRARRRTASAGARWCAERTPPRPRGRAGWRVVGVRAAIAKSPDAARADDHAGHRLRSSSVACASSSASPRGDTGHADGEGNPWPRRTRRDRRCSASPASNLCGGSLNFGAFEARFADHLAAAEEGQHRLGARATPARGASRAAHLLCPVRRRNRKPTAAMSTGMCGIACEPSTRSDAAPARRLKRISRAPG